VKPYGDRISLNRNGRRIYNLDTTMGCASGMRLSPRGCYGACYAAKAARRYGYDFSHTVVRRFGSDDHTVSIINSIASMEMPFVRIGNSGDPSEAWEHTVDVCRVIAQAGKKIVIVTKHWNAMPDSLLPVIEGLDVCINTSISALDSEAHQERRLREYDRLKSVCNSVLRVVSCDFNTDTDEGSILAARQNELLRQDDVVDTVLRIGRSHPLAVSGVVRLREAPFLLSMTHASVFNEGAYLGFCDCCPELCGVVFDRRRPVLRQRFMEFLTT